MTFQQPTTADKEPYFFSFLECSKPKEAKRLMTAAPKNDEFVLPVFGNVCFDTRDRTGLVSECSTITELFWSEFSVPKAV